MKMPKVMMAMMICAGLVAAIGLTACGDDDDEEVQVSCEQALEHWNSDECQDPAEAAVGALNTCADACQGDCEISCQGDPDCTAECANDCMNDDCFPVFRAAIPADCVTAANMITETCNNLCWEDCADTFANVCLLGASSGEECLAVFNTCVNACP